MGLLGLKMSEILKISENLKFENLKISGNLQISELTEKQQISKNLKFFAI